MLDLFGIIDPSKLIAKLKLHLLVHLFQDILRFGPLVGMASEIFECFNAIFRFCSIFSNRLSPSRDIAHQFANQEAFKHRISGGWWQLEDSGAFVQAGSGVRETMRTTPILQRLLGWTNHELLEPGESSVFILI